MIVVEVACVGEWLWVCCCDFTVRFCTVLGAGVGPAVGLKRGAGAGRGFTRNTGHCQVHG